MAGFRDVKVSLAMRDVIDRIAVAAINRLRPQPFLGEVITLDTVRKKVTVRTAGQLDDPEQDLEVNYTQTLSPAQPRDGSTPGNIVEVSGKAGNYFVTKIISGSWTMSGNV